MSIYQVSLPTPPSYGVMQASTAAGFADTTSFAGFAVRLVWFTASALAGLVAFHLRTRPYLGPTRWIHVSVYAR